MSSPNGSPNSTVGGVHSPRPVGAITPNASPSGAKKPATVKKTAKPASKPSKKR